MGRRGTARRHVMMRKQADDLKTLPVNPFYLALYPPEKALPVCLPRTLLRTCRSPQCFGMATWSVAVFVL